jgi:hypothetical protein
MKNPGEMAIVRIPEADKGSAHGEQDVDMDSLRHFQNMHQ